MVATPPSRAERGTARRVQNAGSALAEADAAQALRRYILAQGGRLIAEEFCGAQPLCGLNGAPDAQCVCGALSSTGASVKI